jgi:hypothetical protein
MASRSQARDRTTAASRSNPKARLAAMDEASAQPVPCVCGVGMRWHEDGRRLAKRDLAPTLAAMREAGVDGRELAAGLLDQRLPLGFAFAQA